MSTMRAIRAHAAGGPEVLSLDAVPVPEPGPGEAVVRLAFAGVNFVDVYFRSGLYDPGPRPVVLGREGAGVIEALGPGVDGLVVGDRVAFTDAAGAYAERIRIRADRLLPVPPGLSDQQAAALPLQGMTADYLVRTIGRVVPDDRVLVHAAAGGVGRLACQIAKEDGAEQVMLFVIDILREEATLLVPNDLVKRIAEASFGAKVSGDTVVLPGIMSRKKQIIPALKL